MSVGYLEPLRQAVAHVRRILFKSVDVERWLVLGFVSWVAYLGGGTGGGSGWRAGPGELDGLDRSAGAAAAEGWRWLAARPWVLVLVVTVVVLLIALALLLLWLSSRFRFIFLEDVVLERVEVVEPWRRLRRLGDSLFLWRLGFGLAVLAGLVLPLGALALVGFASGGSWATLPFAVAAVLMLILVGLGAVVVGALLDNFVVPIMYSHELRATAAWRVLLPWVQREPAAFLLYLLFLLALAVAVTAVVVAVGLATCCIGLLLVALPYVGSVLLLPVRMTYRLLGPLFLVQLDPQLARVPRPTPSAGG